MELNTSVAAIVLAAGQGTRMRSSLPKPAHRLCGRPMVSFAIDALSDVAPDKVVVVVGHGSDKVKAAVTDHSPAGVEVAFALQAEQRGTGDAVRVGLEAFTADELDDETGLLIVLTSDAPLIRPSTIARLVETHLESGAGATVLTAVMDDAAGYGRVIRDADGRVNRIVEHRDASFDELEVNEINTAIFCFTRTLVGPALRRINPANAQGELYLTDIVAVLRDAGYSVAAHIGDAAETQGINDRAQLAAAEQELRRRTNSSWLARGVTIVDPDHTYIDTTSTLGEDVTVFPGSLIQGATSIGAGTVVGPGCHIVDTQIGLAAHVEFTRSTGAYIGDHARVGPFAVLRAGDRIEPDQVTGAHYCADA
ncbi:MAG: NTP transferase domain-containing protein [Actinobacteria bacterium]|nr:NTP transferase domain-containing protein [Actinomycetota bacterium]